MAKIPRYISDSPSTAAINTVKMDPSVAAGPYRAAEASTAHLMSIFQNEMGAWGKVLAQKEAEQKAAAQKNMDVNDSLYNAQAMAQLSMGMNDIKQQATQQADGVTDISKIADNQFQQLADQLLAQAPSDKSKITLMKQFIGARAQLYNNMSNTGIKLNNQRNMDKIEGMLSQYEAAASHSPAAIGDLRQHAEAMFETMSKLGVPENAKNQIRNKFNNNLDYYAASSTAEKDPQAILQQVQSGGLDHLGPTNLKRITTTANASLKAMTVQTKQSLDDVERRIMSGQPLPQDFEQRAQLASKYGLEDQLHDIVKLTEVAKVTEGMNYSNLLATKADLERMNASGELNLPPAKLAKLYKYLDTNAKAMKRDPFKYAEERGNFTPFNSISDFSKLDPQEAQQRQFRALQIKETYGINAPALKNEEVAVLANQLQTAPADQQGAIIGNLASLGEDTIRAVTEHLDSKNQGLAQAIRLSDIDPELTNTILKGRELIAASPNSFKLPPGERSQALPNVAVEDPKYRDDMINAGRAYMAAATARGEDLDLNTAIDRANNLITVDRNGLFTGKYKTTAPAPGMKSYDFEKFVDNSLNNRDSWAKFATGSPARTQAGQALMLNRLRPSDYDYVHNKDGKYSVYYEGSPVVDNKDKPVRVDLKKLYRSTS